MNGRNKSLVVWTTNVNPKDIEVAFQFRKEIIVLIDMPEQFLFFFKCSFLELGLFLITLGLHFSTSTYFFP